MSRRKLGWIVAACVVTAFAGWILIELNRPKAPYKFLQGQELVYHKTLSNGRELYLYHLRGDFNSICNRAEKELGKPDHHRRRYWGSQRWGKFGDPFVPLVVTISNGPQFVKVFTPERLSIGGRYNLGSNDELDPSMKEKPKDHMISVTVRKKGAGETFWDRLIRIFGV